MFEVFESTESEVRSYCRKYPVEFSKAKNAEIFSVEGERYIDFLAVAGSMNYGHNNPEIKAKIVEYLSEDHIINALDMYTQAKEEFLQTFKEKILEPRNMNYKVLYQDLLYIPLLYPSYNFWHQGTPQAQIPD